ncbi:Trypsin-like peptidase domain-containing protein [Prevotella communis]|uniref:Trypsin-like peptidase domain-containing protein n=1 Tax=Prevotella communis TaxID=2913614 RepID=A0A1H0FRT9_9BACT|nr:FHA domain-containing protein [Prevotella communis]SDG81418.1 Trypsin-like peptidase domain-containing protein [Prevotella communis]SDN97261.1 Trypsin-like peptidase domain-containing protein [Prevotella communis]
MRLLKIGRDAACDIVLYSENVSSLHAELTLLNSGDIQLEDKGSRNGTFVMNQPIKPGKPVNIRRGDAVRFADVELQWSQVPQPEDNSAYKAIYGIGSHFNNDIQISGNTVSRYHATIKVGRDNKVYIVDHSKNGTTVDGRKIAANVPTRIKKSSAVVCGGVPVNLKAAPIQWPSEAWKAVVGIAASLLVLVGVGVGIWAAWPNSKPNIKALEKATACVFEQYYVQVTYKDDPFIGHIKGWPEKWTFGIDNNGNLALGTPGSNISPIGARGTAFFISKDGEMGTNRHIALPWEYLPENAVETIKQAMEKNLNDNSSSILVPLLNAAINSGKVPVEEARAWFTRLQKSEINISGSMEYIGVALTGTNFTTIADLYSCQVIAESGDKERDVALIRLNSKKTPDDIVKGGIFDIENARVDETSLIPQEEELTTIGYPSEFGTGMNLITKGTEYLPTVHRTYVSKTPDDDMFQLQSNVVGGQSGSPIIDKEHRLVGVVFGSYRGTDVAYGCNIKHLKALYDKNKARN